MRPAVGLLLFYKEKNEENENMKNYKIAVAGTGYVGLSLSVLLAQHNQVMAVDIVQAKVDMINNHKSPIQDDYIEKYVCIHYDIEIILNVPLEEFEEFKSHSLSVRTPSGRKTDLKQAPVRGLGTPNGGIVVFDKTSGEAMNIMPKSSAHVTLRCQDE